VALWAWHPGLRWANAALSAGGHSEADGGFVEQVRRATGRPSLSGTATSPQIAFRVAATLRERAAAVAAREGKTISQLAREALEERIAHPR